MSESEFAKSLSAPRREILTYIKAHTVATIAQLASELGVTDEAARQHVLYLENQGWIVGTTARVEPVRAASLAGRRIFGAEPRRNLSIHAMGTSVPSPPTEAEEGGVDTSIRSAKM